MMFRHTVAVFLVGCGFAAESHSQFMQSPTYSPYGQNTRSTGGGIVPGIPTNESGFVYVGRLGPFGPPNVMFTTPYGYMTGPLLPGLPYYFSGDWGQQFPTGGYGGSYLQGSADSSSWSARFEGSSPRTAPAQDPQPKVRGPRKEAPERPEQRRNLFDQFVEERARQMKPDEMRVMQQREALLNALHRPTRLDITSGNALNLILESLEVRPGQLDKVPVISLEEELLRQLNFSKGSGSGSFGLLRHEGKVAWPNGIANLAVVAAQRKEMETKFQTAYQEISDGKPNLENLKALQKLSDQISEQVSANIRNMDLQDYLEAKRFLKSLDDTLTFMKQPDAGNWLPGKAKIKPKSLQELTKLMGEKGVRFAPALLGSEAAYFTMHRKLVDLYHAANVPLKQ